MAYFDAMYRSYDIAVTDPVADWSRRGLSTEEFDCPTQTNLVELFNVMRAHASRYIDAYYDSDDQLRADTEARLARQLGTRAQRTGGMDGGVTKAWLSRLIAGYIYEGSFHPRSGRDDVVGTTSCGPTATRFACTRTAGRASSTFFQRVVNNNFALQLRRAPMLANLSRSHSMSGSGALHAVLRRMPCPPAAVRPGASGTVADGTEEPRNQHERLTETRGGAGERTRRRWRWMGGPQG